MAKVEPLPDYELDGLSPGVRHVVTWLRREQFLTTDSGDGSNHKAGMECAPPFPMVAMRVYPSRLQAEANRLCALIEAELEHLTLESGLQIEATYWPVTAAGVLLLIDHSEGGEDMARLNVWAETQAVWCCQGATFKPLARISVDGRCYCTVCGTILINGVKTNQVVREEHK